MASSSHHRLISVVLLLCLTLVGCTSNAPTTPPTVTVPVTTLTITGSATVSSLLSALQPAFESDVKMVHLKALSGSGTSAAIKGALDGTIDIAAMAREPKEAETKQGLKGHKFGQAAVVILVRQDNPVTNLTAAQVADIFAGKITNWSAVGGPDQKIAMFVRDEEESATQELRRAIIGKTPFPEGSAKVLTSPTEMYTAIEGTPNSIGLGIWPSVLTMGAKIKAVNVDGNTPTNATYPVLLSLCLGYQDKRQANVQSLIDWLGSERGRQELQRFGVILVQ